VEEKVQQEGVPAQEEPVEEKAHLQWGAQEEPAQEEPVEEKVQQEEEPVEEKVQQEEEPADEEVQQEEEPADEEVQQEVEEEPADEEPAGGGGDAVGEAAAAEMTLAEMLFSQLETGGGTDAAFDPAAFEPAAGGGAGRRLGAEIEGESDDLDAVDAERAQAEGGATGYGASDVLCVKALRHEFGWGDYSSAANVLVALETLELITPDMKDGHPTHTGNDEWGGSAGDLEPVTISSMVADQVEDEVVQEQAAINAGAVGCAATTQTLTAIKNYYMHGGSASPPRPTAPGQVGPLMILLSNSNLWDSGLSRNRYDTNVDIIANTGTAVTVINMNEEAFERAREDAANRESSSARKMADTESASALAQALLPEDLLEAMQTESGSTTATVLTTSLPLAEGQPVIDPSVYNHILASNTPYALELPALLSLPSIVLPVDNVDSIGRGIVQAICPYHDHIGNLAAAAAMPVIEVEADKRHRSGSTVALICMITALSLFICIVLCVCMIRRRNDRETASLVTNASVYDKKLPDEGQSFWQLPRRHVARTSRAGYI
jgi:hypothetical protein